MMNPKTKFKMPALRKFISHESFKFKTESIVDDRSKILNETQSHNKPLFICEEIKNNSSSGLPSLVHTTMTQEWDGSAVVCYLRGNA